MVPSTALERIPPSLPRVVSDAPINPAHPLTHAQAGRRTAAGTLKNTWSWGREKWWDMNNRRWSSHRQRGTEEIHVFCFGSTSKALNLDSLVWWCLFSGGELQDVTGKSAWFQSPGSCEICPMMGPKEGFIERCLRFIGGMPFDFPIEMPISFGTISMFDRWKIPNGIPATTSTTSPPLPEATAAPWLRAPDFPCRIWSLCSSTPQAIWDGCQQAKRQVRIVCGKTLVKPRMNHLDRQWLVMGRENNEPSPESPILVEVYCWIDRHTRVLNDVRWFVNGIV